MTTGGALAVGAVLWSGVPAFAEDAAAAPTVQCSITDPRLAELSGLVAVGDRVLAMNDGGDGLVAARVLRREGLAVSCVRLFEGDDVPAADGFDVVVDAIFGTEWVLIQTALVPEGDVVVDVGGLAHTGT